jgi:hypothetical protein
VVFAINERAETISLNIRDFLGALAVHTNKRYIGELSDDHHSNPFLIRDDDNHFKCHITSCYATLFTPSLQQYTLFVSIYILVVQL